MTEDELREALDRNTSIADVAAEQGVDVQVVIDALVADITADIDDKVADGDIDEARAAELKETLEERVTAVVNGELRARGPRGPGGPGGPGHGRPGVDDAEGADDAGS